mgnify:FL=1
MTTFSSSRVDRDEIYDGIIADLQEAVEVLPWYSEGFFSTPERISKNAAYGLLARTALYAAGYALHWDLNTYDKSTLQMRRPLDESRVRKLYTIADEACKAVISKGENSLLSKYEDVFRALNEGGVYNPEEVMFDMLSLAIQPMVVWDIQMDFAFMLPMPFMVKHCLCN